MCARARTHTQSQHPVLFLQTHYSTIQRVQFTHTHSVERPMVILPITLQL